MSPCPKPFLSRCSAVDNILLRLRASGLPALRLGRPDSVHPALRECLPGGGLWPDTSVARLRGLARTAGVVRFWIFVGLASFSPGSDLQAQCEQATRQGWQAYNYQYRSHSRSSLCCCWACRRLCPVTMCTGKLNTVLMRQSGPCLVAIAQSSTPYQMPSTSMHLQSISYQKVRCVLQVGATCLGVNSPLLQRHTFDVVIVDEAGQMTLPATIAPLLKARAFVLVRGQHLQIDNKMPHPSNANVQLHGWLRLHRSAACLPVEQL